ncbi:MAG: hypothetical protein KDD40_02560 [Bdellovibrionales bacterium]|nr:hypothetical protein [Bdellovibrionales bacterium]
MSNIVFALESLCLLKNPRALNAYHCIDQLAKTGHNIKIITTYEDKDEYTFSSQNILIYRPFKGLNFLQTLNAYPLLIDKQMDLLHLFAPFSHYHWSKMRNLKLLAQFTKKVNANKNSFSGYDPSFHQWPKKFVKALHKEFDIIFSHFHDQMPGSHSQPLTAPQVNRENPQPTIEKNINIVGSFSQVLDEPEMLHTLEKFLEDHREWQVKICGGWGTLGQLSKSSQQLYWQDKQQQHQWQVDECDPLKNGSLLIDLSATLSDNLYFAQQCMFMAIPYIAKTELLQHIKNKELYSLKNIWILDNFEAALYDKLLLTTELPQSFDPPSPYHILNDTAVNAFNRLLNDQL